MYKVVRISCYLIHLTSYITLKRKYIKLSMNQIIDQLTKGHNDVSVTINLMIFYLPQ